MNREILFKGFHPCENGKDRVFVDGEWINGEWIEGNGINQQIDVAGNKHAYIALPIKSRAYPPMTTVEWVEVIPETVGQYTGLTDKNGKKIFEGDILQDYLFVGKVVYNDVLAAFIVEINDSTKNWYHWSPLNKGDIDRKSKLQYTEVISNIHDGGIDDGKNAEKD